MTDLTVDDHIIEKQPPESPSEFFMPTVADFEMDDSVMELINNQVDLHSFDVSHILNTDAGIIPPAGAISSSPDSYLHTSR